MDLQYIVDPHACIVFSAQKHLYAALYKNEYYYYHYYYYYYYTHIVQAELYGGKSGESFLNKHL